MNPASRPPNRLARERSPYLLQHAHNPVDWYPWGDEAFARARQENKPIFLSIGYSTCHWCHVMERESFENDEIATVMNAHFVCIKVDREERPDLDRLYMSAVQATTGRGGWPMSVWLTPDHQPFYCGTYFPPEVFQQLLQRVADVWKANHAGVLAQAGQLTAALAAHLTNQPPVVGRESPAAGGPAPSRRLDDTPLRLAFEQLRSAYDPEHGGFGGAPKFPHPVTLNFLFRHYASTGQAAARDMAVHQLRAMALGGLFDQLGGGFHRYSVDERWLVSHFEKMLYDQALLIGSYCDAYQITRDPFHADIARRTCDYVLRDLTSPEGAFYCAEDADSEGVEGKFYVWTQAAIEQQLGDKADAFCRAYGVTAAGNWEHGKNILHVASPAAASFSDERATLVAARARRVRPHRDEKVLIAWNGLMISALARASRVLDDSGSLALAHAATRAAQFVLGHHFLEGRLLRTPTVPGMLEDYAFFTSGLVDLYEATFDPQWLFRSAELADQMLALFSDTEQGGFFQTDGQDPSVIFRLKDDYDGAEPSGNSVATLLLLRLAAFTDESRYRTAAEKTLGVFHERLRQTPLAMPQMLGALDWALAGPVEITISGQADGADTQALRQAVNERYLPHRILRWQPSDGPASAQVCRNQVCQLPVSDLAGLGQLLDTT